MWKHVIRQPDNKLTPWSWALLEILIVAHLLKIYQTFHANWKYMTLFTKSQHWSPFRIRWIQSIASQHISFRFILILYSYLPPCHPSRQFSYGLPTRSLYELVFTPILAILFSLIDTSHNTWRGIRIELIFLIILDVEYELSWYFS
jgi:hypothetical protein